MMKSPLFKSFLFTLALVGIWNAFAFFFHLFTTIKNFDMSFHFLGGFFIGISALWILTWGGRSGFSYGQLLFWAVGMAFVAGIIWELFELYFGITYLYSPDYWGDNGMDVIMDITGGLFSTWYSFLKLKKKYNG